MMNNKDDKILMGSDLDSTVGVLLQKTMCFDTDNKQTRHSALKNEGSASALGSSL